MMTCKQWALVILGTGVILTGSAQADERRDLWGQGRVEVVFGSGGPAEGCGGCDIGYPSHPGRYPVYDDADFGRGRGRWKDRAEAAREWEKERREAFREREKDRREWEREQAKADREAWKEEEKARRKR